MTRSLCSCLLISVLAPAITSAAHAQNVSDPWGDPAMLLELARDWKEFGLPIAPPDAVFATGNFDGGVHFIGRPKQTDLLLILALREANGGNPSRYWTLTGIEPLRDPKSPGRFERVDFEIVPEGRSDLPVTCAELGGRVPYLNGPLAMAIQTQLRNQPRLALSLLQLGAEFELTGFHRPGAHVRPTSPPEPRRALATLAWSCWRTQLIEPNADRAKILDRLEKITKSPLWPDSQENRRLIDDLKQTLRVKSVATNAIEAQIVDLINMDNRERWSLDGGYGNKESADPNDVDPRYRSLWLMGFDAVPALMEHLDDGRLTRREFTYINGPSERTTRVYDVVTDILVDLSAGTLQTTRSRGDGLGYGLHPTEVRAWWTAAKAAGEKKYLLDNVLPKRQSSNRFKTPARPESPNMPEHVKAMMREMEERTNRIDADIQRDSCRPRAHILHVIAAKYPEELPELYKRATEHCPETAQHLLSNLLARCNANSDVKAQLLLESARSPHQEARLAAVRALSELRHPATCAAVAEGVALIPRKWEKGEMQKLATQWTHLATKCDDALVWAELEKVARQCDTGQRIEILWALNCGCGGPECSNRKRRVAFLDRFLDDQAVREDSSDPTYRSFGGFDAGCGASRLVVRDAAAYTIASILAISPQPQFDAGEAAWAEFRSRIRPAVEKELKVP